MCKWGTSKNVKVYIQPYLSHTGIGRWDFKQIDSCIADIVEALQNGGINMTSSCCGHGKGNGEIVLVDGRKLIIETLKGKDRTMTMEENEKIYDYEQRKLIANDVFKKVFGGQYTYINEDDMYRIADYMSEREKQQMTANESEKKYSEKEVEELCEANKQEGIAEEKLINYSKGNQMKTEIKIHNAAIECNTVILKTKNNSFGVIEDWVRQKDLYDILNKTYFTDSEKIQDIRNLSKSGKETFHVHM